MKTTASNGFVRHKLLLSLSTRNTPAQLLSSIRWHLNASLPTVAISSLLFPWQELWIDGPSHSFSITYSCWLLNSVFQIMKHHHKTLMSIREEAEIKAFTSQWCRGINQLVITKKMTYILKIFICPSSGDDGCLVTNFAC